MDSESTIKSFYKGSVALFADPESPCKAMLVRGDAAFSIQPVAVLSFLSSADNGTTITKVLVDMINDVTYGDPRPIRGLESIEFFKLSEEQMLNKEIIDELAAVRERFEHEVSKRERSGEGTPPDMSLVNELINEVLNHQKKPLTE